MKFAIVLLAAALAGFPAAAATSGAEAVLTRYTSADWGDPAGAWVPRDDCADLPGAHAFRLALAEAVLRRDADTLLALTDPAVMLDFGGGEGREEWRARLVDPQWQHWEALEALLPLGCAADGEDRLVMPWYFAQDIGDADPSSAMMVIADEVPLLAEPQPQGRRIARLSWEMVTLAPEAFTGRPDPGPYVRVINGAGTGGWIAEEHVRSYLDYRLIATRTAQGWRISGFVAGD